MEWATLNYNWAQRISKICYLGTPWASLSRVGRRETKCESNQISVVSPSLTDSSFLSNSERNELSGAV